MPLLVLQRGDVPRNDKKSPTTISLSYFKLSRYNMANKAEWIRRNMKHIVITAELIEEEEGGYTVYCPELDIYTQGDDIEDAIKNLKEAAELHIEELGIENIRLKEIKRRQIELVM